MKFDVKILQTLEGHVTIEASSAEEAVAIADRMYNGEGCCLPDMDDSESLKFEATII